MLKSTKVRIGLVIMVAFMVYYVFCLPATLFHDPYSTVLEDRDGALLSATISDDGQWRFPERDTVPEKFAVALTTFEDKRFYSHPGIDIRALGRAVRENIRSRHTVSGGSTLTMQVIRLSRKGKSRNLYQKIVEMIQATRLEWRMSKNEIISLYASHAPFGGNVVGLDAACWRYFGREPESLSWGEAALLAVLPNAPSLIHLNKNREKLRAKRDRLLDKLVAQGKIDPETCALAKEELIPDAPLDLPRYARHLLTRAAKDGQKGKRIASTVQLPLQIRVEQIIEEHHRRLEGNQIHNAAALVLDVKTGNAIAYVGNTTGGDQYRGGEVDVITSPRSTGSILKPFLFAAMLDEGKMLPRSLQPDVPTLISGFSPKNFTKLYDGIVPADQALIRSLNVPAVHMLRQFRYEKFHSLLTQAGMTTLTRPPDHYGLTLILGGAEGTLWDITGMYASMGRTLNNYFDHPGSNKYDRSDFHGPQYQQSKEVRSRELDARAVLSASAIFETLQVLTELYRPGEETGWRHFSSAKKIAWKTGTSFGLRDGWAVGVTPEYAVGVWVGNADGEGRTGLTGTETAAPILFDIFAQLPGGGWFTRPQQEMERITVCKKSGYRNSSLCPEADTVWIPRPGLESPPCPFHQRIHLSADRKFRVNADCEKLQEMRQETWFVISPIEQFYFKARNLSFKPLPPFRADCFSGDASAMEIVYPKPGSRIFVPRELDGSLSAVIFELAHRNPKSNVFWHIDGEFVGTTRKNHRITLQPPKGRHILTVVDDSGASLQRAFEVVSER